MGAERLRYDQVPSRAAAIRATLIDMSGQIAGLAW
jgi:hypothetical protein